MSRELGDRQRSCLRALASHGHYPGTGWLYDNHSGTIKILESLVRRGLVDKEDRPARGRLFNPGYGRFSYKINDEGLRILGNPTAHTGGRS